MNRLVLTASLAERCALRYTPAGLPALDVRLAHESRLSEDGQPRQVALKLKAVAVGAVAHSANALALGQAARFAGFLGAARNGQGIVFHITEIAAL